MLSYLKNKWLRKLGRTICLLILKERTKWKKNIISIKSNLKRCWGSVSEGSASFGQIRIRNIFPGSGTGSRSRSEPIAHVPHPYFLTLNLSPFLPHPTSHTTPLLPHTQSFTIPSSPHLPLPSSLIPTPHGSRLSHLLHTSSPYS